MLASVEVIEAAVGRPAPRRGTLGGVVLFDCPSPELVDWLAALFCVGSYGKKSALSGQQAAYLAEVPIPLLGPFADAVATILREHYGLCRPATAAPTLVPMPLPLEQRVAAAAMLYAHRDGGRFWDFLVSRPFADLGDDVERLYGIAPVEIERALAVIQQLQVVP